MQMKELLATIDGYPPERLDISLEKIVYTPDVLTIALLVVKDPDDGDDAMGEAWHVECHGYRHSRIEHHGRFHRVAMFDNEPLLWEYADPHVQLYFNGAVADPDLFYWEIHQLHEQLYGTHIPMSVLTGEVGFRRMQKTSFGLFATGPQQLMKAYAACLSRHGARCSMTSPGPRPAAQVSGLLLGEGYVIAEEFIVKIGG